MASFMLTGVFVSLLNSETTAKMHAFEAHYKTETDEIAAKVLSAKEEAWSGSALFGLPYILLCYDTRAGELPDGPASMTLSPVWIDTVFGKDTSRDLYSLGKPLGRLPEFRCATAYLVVYTKEKSGRQIELDIGSVPEYLWYAEVYAVDLKRMVRIKLPGRVYGTKAQKPWHHVGIGAEGFSSLEGAQPSDRRIQKHIDSLVNRHP
jgi:hypothetical protein